MSKKVGNLGLTDSVLLDGEGTVRVTEEITTGLAFTAAHEAATDVLLTAVYANGTRLRSISGTPPAEHEVRVQPTAGSGTKLLLTFHADTQPESGDYYVVDYEKA